MERLSRLYDPGKRNSIGFLRFCFAALVIFSHCFQIGALGIEPLWARTDVDIGHMSVFWFFILSGFLIARSCATVSSLPRYLWHRCLRIFPAYWVCLLVVAFLIAPIFYCLRAATPTLQGFFTLEPDSPAQFVTRNFFLVQIQKTIAHLLEGSPQTLTMDGPLWTLPYEFFCYLLVAALGVFGLWTRRRGWVGYSYSPSGWHSGPATTSRGGCRCTGSSS
jgi:peptidoglycan/LPS O-acetylase OafA/YrhL